MDVLLQLSAANERGEYSLSIARNAAALIEDGATLQLGLDAMPETILAQLAGRRDLGVHSGAIGDQVALLMQAGVMANARKSMDRGLTVAGITFGSKRLHDFAHRVPSSCASNARTSFSVSTTGTCLGCLARTTPSIHGSSTCNTSQYRNSNADNA